jgi:general secretion pathway protein G
MGLRKRSGRARRQRGFTLIELLIVVAIIGIIASLAIPNLRDAMDRAKQKATMTNMRAIGNALEMYAVDHNVYPKGLTDANGGTLGGFLSPLYLRTVPPADDWSNAWHVDTNASGTQYTITSHGRDGIPGNNPGGQTSDFNCDIIFSNGSFHQRPK